MVERLSRTYDLKEGTVEWIDKFAEEQDVDKREVVERALRVYAIKLKRDAWQDPKWGSKVDERFESIK